VRHYSGPIKRSRSEGETLTDHILKTLAQSVKTGLNAVLTPAQCRELLNSIHETAIPGSPLDGIIDKLNAAAHDYINALTEELTPSALRKRRK
jgi:hypothetical protein